MVNELKKYLRDSGLTEASFGAAVGKKQQTVHQWVKGIAIPRREEMRRIYVATGGAVQPNDFYDLPDLTAEPVMEEGVAA